MHFFLLPSGSLCEKVIILGEQYVTELTGSIQQR
jgi:hypothetical protein